MLSFREAMVEDAYPAVCPSGEDDGNPLDGWDFDVFPEVELRPELRLFAGTCPDVTLRCQGGRDVRAHRAVLSEVAYFASLFGGHFREREAELLEVDEERETLYEVLRWIYCQDSAVDKDTAPEVLRLAEFYGVDGLVDHCARVLCAAEIATAAAVAQRSARDVANKGSQEAATTAAEAEAVASAAVVTDVPWDSFEEAFTEENGVGQDVQAPVDPPPPVKLKGV